MVPLLANTIQAIEPDAIETLTRLVNVNSFHGNPVGLKEVARQVAEVGREHGMIFSDVPVAGRDTFHLLHDGTAGGEVPFFGLVGHLDTVFPPDASPGSLRREGDRLIGPGVLDMKAGVVTALYALIAVKKMTGSRRLPVKVLFNCDEEIGSPDSRALIERELKDAAGAFVFEGRSDRNHALITSRKGIIMGTLEVSGRASHAGDAPEEGANAVVEAAHKIVGLSRLSGLEAGTAITTGKVTGGYSANQVPDFCRAEFDIRFNTPEAETLIREKTVRLMARTFVPGTRSRISLRTVRPPFVRSAGCARLRDGYLEAANLCGCPLEECSAGAGSDANLIAAMGVPTLDGLGPEGSGAHSDREYIIRQSLMDSIKVFALFLSRLIHPRSRR